MFPMPTNMTWTQLIGAGIALGVLTLLIEAAFAAADTGR